MQNNSLKIKIILIAGLLFVTPLAVFADEATTTKSFLEEVQKDEKKEEIRKQLKDTIDLCSALVSKIQNLSKRISEREAILVEQKNLSEKSKDKIDAIQERLDAVLEGANERINDNLVNLAELILDSNKPAKFVKDFRKEVNKVKTELVTARKLVVEMIDLVKKESLQVETDNEDNNMDNDNSTTTEQVSE